MKCAICKSKTFEGRCMCDIIENARNYIQPEAIDYEKTIREIGWDDDCIHSALNGFHHGFKTGHASRQQEVDALKDDGKSDATVIIDNIKYIKSLKEEISTLTTQLDEVTKVKERYEEALEFYADERHWLMDEVTGDRIVMHEMNDDIYKVGFEEDDAENVAGKRAREALNGSGDE